MRKRGHERTMSRAAGRLIVVAAAMMAGVLAVPSAAPAADGDVTVHRNVEIRMSDGVVLRADEFVPSKGCPCTPILSITPYGKGEASVVQQFDSSQIHPALIEHGYAEIVIDTRGTGASGGTWGIFSPREQQDYGEIVRWAAARPYGDGQVLALGQSYRAIAPLLAAEQPGTEALKALFVEVPLGDVYRDIFTAGGNPNAQFLSVWSLGLVTSASLLEPVGDNPVDLNAETQHLLGAATQTAPDNLDVLLGTDSEKLPADLQRIPPWDGSWYRERSPLTKIDRIRVPVFMIAARNDIFQRTQPLLYQSLNLPPAKKKLILTPGYHLTFAEHLDTTDVDGNRIPSVDDLAKLWFDKWARGIDNGIERFPTSET